MFYALRCCPQGWRAYDTKTASGDTVDFGFYAKCWYNLLDLKPQGGTRLIVEHSPDCNPPTLAGAADGSAARYL